MKIKQILLTIGLVFAGGVSGLVGLTHASSEPATIAKADTTTGSTTIYLEVGDDWLVAGAVARLIPNVGNWVKPTKVNSPNYAALYSFTVPAGVSSFRFSRMNPSDADSLSGEWNCTTSINYSTSYNYYHVTGVNGYDCPYTQGWMNVYYRSNSNHQDFRLTVINEDYNWFDANAITTIRFFDGTEIQFSKFIAFSGSAIYTNTLTCSTTVPSGDDTIYATGFNIFRKSNDGSETWSQTGNWEFSAENKDMNAFVIKAKNGDAQFYDGVGQSKVIGPEYNAMAYGIFFLEKTNSICYGKEENDNSSALSAVWTQLQGAATTSTNGNKLLGGEEEIAAFKTSTEYYTHDAYQRYAHIVGRYSTLIDFVGVNSSLSGRLVVNGLTANSNVIIIVTGILVLSVAGFATIVIRRKKQEN